MTEIYAKRAQQDRYSKLKPIDKHAAKRLAIDLDMKNLLCDVDDIASTSISFKNQRYVHNHRTQKLKSKHDYAAAAITQQSRDGYEFKPFTWPGLLLAVQAGDLFNVRTLIKNRSYDPNDSNELARCVDAAAKSGNERIARALIFIGANPTTRYPDHPRTEFHPLYVAAEAGHTHLVKALLDLGADVDAAPFALHCACSQVKRKMLIVIVLLFIFDQSVPGLVVTFDISQMLTSTKKRFQIF